MLSPMCSIIEVTTGMTSTKDKIVDEDIKQ